MYFYLNQLEPKLALTAFLSTEAGVLVGVNYYRTTDFFSQHLKKKGGGEKTIIMLEVFRNPRNRFLGHVVSVPMEYCVYLFDFSRSSQRCHCFFPLQTSVVSFLRQSNYWPVS